MQLPDVSKKLIVRMSSKVGASSTTLVFIISRRHQVFPLYAYTLVNTARGTEKILISMHALSINQTVCDV